MKKIFWLIIISSAVIIPLTAIIIITKVLMKPRGSWWWFSGALIFYFIVGLAIGIIFLIFKLKSKKEPKIRLEPKDAREKAVYELKMDEDNPDNFIIKEQRIVRAGMQGYARTPIYWLHGKGSEKNEVIDALINLDNPKGEIVWQRGKSEKAILEIIRLMAENPESEITEERTIGIDEFGRPTTRVTTRKASIAEKKLEDEKKEADSANII
jgi:hypothetical protein